MENGQNNSSSTASAKVPDFSRTKKENKFLKIFIPILAALIVVAGVIAILFFTGVIGGKNNDPEESLDVDIEDEDMISKINNELGVLFGKPVENSGIIINSSNYDDISLWKNLDLTEEQKIYRILNALDESQKIELDPVQKEVAASVWAENGGAPETLNFDNVVAYSGEIVGEKYKEIFGVNAEKDVMNSNRVQYLTTYDVYFMVPAIETSTAYERHYHISRYFENGDKVYVYFNGGLYDTDSHTAYCDIFTPGTTEVEVCKNVEADQTFTINEENDGYYLLRMFTFYKKRDGKIFYLGAESPIIKWNIDPETIE